MSAATIAHEYLTLVEEGWEVDLQEFLGRVPEALRAEVASLIETAQAPPPAPSAPAIGPEEYAQEYLALAIHGRHPGLEEYLDGLPDEMREETLVLIDGFLANTPVQDEESVAEQFLEPRTEVEVLLDTECPPPFDPSGSVQALLAYLIPANMREAWMGEWAFARVDRRVLGLSRFEVELLSFGELYDGLAQRAPLSDLRDEIVASDRGVRWGWRAWRLSGPLLLAGTLLLNGAVLFAGVLLLGAAIMATLLLREREDGGAVRLRNGVLGGLAVALTGSLLLLGAAAIPLIVTIAASKASIAGAIFGGLASLVAALFAYVTGAGRVPAPWWPRRLVRLNSARSRG